MVLCNSDECTGCMACFNICKAKAIKMSEDKEGFLYPTIDSSRCIECGECRKVCPSIENIKDSLERQEVYACWSKNKKVRKVSSSGGIFTELANAILEENGVVYGVKIDDQGRAVHFRGVSVEDIKEMQGSKYIQSDIGQCFCDAKADLDAGKKVLFTGTPCQIAGLKKFLKKQYDNLMSCDLVCHGVPSPKIFNDYVELMEEIHGARLQRIWFRDKSKGWEEYCMKIIFENGKVYKKSTYNDVFVRGFLRNYYLRPKCYNCLYANTNRVADITLGDFWGYKRESWKARNTDKGISMCMINSDNGQRLFEKVASNLVVYKKTLSEAIAGNHCLIGSFDMPENRNKFWTDYREKGYRYIIQKYCYPEKIPLLTVLKSSRIGVEYGYLKRWVKKNCLKNKN